MGETIYKIEVIDGSGQVSGDPTWIPMIQVFKTMTAAEIFILNFMPYEFWNKVRIVPRTHGNRGGRAK